MTSDTGAANPRILIVDDSRVIRVAAKKILRDHYELAEAGDGAEALEVLSQLTDISVVLSDLSMPNLGGMELLEQMRNSGNAYLKNMPVIIVTGAEDDDGTKSRALSAGASDFITKPFDQAQLLARIKAQTDIRQKNEQLEKTAITFEECSTTDPVTGLANMRGFQEQARQAIAYSVRHRTDLALIIIEPDQIETLDRNLDENSAGVSILQEVAGIIRHSIRCEDISARLDGYRFAVLSPGANPIGARRLARRLCAGVVDWKCPAPARVSRITLSAGVVAEDVQRNTHLEDLIDEAVDRMLAARASGGNQVIYAQGERAPSASLDIPTLAEPAPAGSHVPVAEWEPDATPAPVQPVTDPPAVASGGPAPDLNRALQLLKSGLGERLDPHLRTLVRECLPLLEYWNRSRNLQLDAELERIRQACREPGLDLPPLPAEAKSLL